jgi:hypothetical protein
MGSFTPCRRKARQAEGVGLERIDGKRVTVGAIFRTFDAKDALGLKPSDGPCNLARIDAPPFCNPLVAWIALACDHIGVGQ